MTSIGLFRRVVPSESSYLFEAIAVPLNYSATCTFTSDEDFEVDWGDGTFIAYSAGSASVVPSGTINIRSDNAVTTCRFVTNTYNTINITKSDTLTSAYAMCYALTSLTSFAIDDSSNITSFSNAFRGTSSLLTFPVIDLSSALNFNNAFYESGVNSFPTLSYPLVTNFSGAWYRMTGSTFGDLTAPNGVNFSNAFEISSIVEIGDVSISASANVNRMFRDADVLRCIKSITTTSSMTNKASMFTGTGVLKYPNPDDVVDLISASGDAYTNPSPTDCDEFTYNGVLTEGSHPSSNAYLLDTNGDLPQNSSLGPECIIKFGHTDVTIDASTGWTDNGDGSYYIQVATNVALRAFDLNPWYYQLAGTSQENRQEIEDGLGIFAVDYQTISIELL
jgi:hypothetical protein